MNITGIIAEYNPFHNGHAYQLRCAKEETDADYIVIIMSGNFVQRGSAAVMDKFCRAQTALLQGADLVIELPALWSTASAEYFACAGVALLEQLGCISTLCYGCESPDSDLFSAISKLLSHETPAYKELLSGFLKQGLSFAMAREKAVLALLPDADQAAVMEAVIDILENPNNILALEYRKAIISNGFSIQTHPVLRQGKGHHSQDYNAKYDDAGAFASASAIRRFLAECPAAALRQTDAAPDITAVLKQTMPRHAYESLAKYCSFYPLLFDDDCSQMLHYCLLKNAAGYAHYADCTQDFSNKIRRHLDAYTGFTQFCALLKSKDLAYTRISRILLHILLDIRQEDYTYWRGHSYMPFARVLGFRRESRPLLAHIKKHSAIPLLTRTADAGKILGTKDLAFFEKNLFADAVYRALAVEKGVRAMPDEYRRQIIIV